MRLINDILRWFNGVYNGDFHIFLLLFSDDSGDISISPPISSPKSTSIEVLSKRCSSNRSRTICNSFDHQQSQESPSKHTDNRVSLCQKSLSSETILDGSEKSSSTLHIECDQDGLKSQLLDRCGQNDILLFSEIYAAR